MADITEEYGRYCWNAALRLAYQLARIDLDHEILELIWAPMEPPPSQLTTEEARVYYRLIAASSLVADAMLKERSK